MEKAKKLTLALGEGSHTHIMRSKEDVKYRIENEEIDFELTSDGVITHEEHDRMILPPGKYHKYPQFELDPFTNRHVAVWD